MKLIESETFIIFTTTYFILKRAQLCTNIKSNNHKRLNISKIIHAYPTFECATDPQNFTYQHVTNKFCKMLATFWGANRPEMCTQLSKFCIFLICWRTYSGIKRKSYSRMRREKFSSIGEDEVKRLKIWRRWILRQFTWLSCCNTSHVICWIRYGVFCFKNTQTEGTLVQPQQLCSLVSSIWFPLFP